MDKNEQIIVGVSDMKVTDNPGSVLVTYSLGSCIGVSIYDPVVRVGGGQARQWRGGEGVLSPGSCVRSSRDRLTVEDGSWSRVAKGKRTGTRRPTGGGTGR